MDKIKVQIVCDLNICDRNLQSLSPNCSIMPLDEAMEILLAINHLPPSLHYNSERLSKQEIQLQRTLRK